MGYGHGHGQRKSPYPVERIRACVERILLWLEILFVGGVPFEVLAQVEATVEESFF